MVDGSGLTLSEALTRFIAARKVSKKSLDGHQELGRFVAWCGRDRNVSELSPTVVADYGQLIGLGGADSAQRLSPVKSFLTFLKDEGWVQSGLAAHLRIPRGRRSVARRAGQSPDIPLDSAQLSQEGFQRLKDQLSVLKEQRLSVVEDIRLAMADKDFRENSPLEAAKESQGAIESKIRELESTLSRAVVVAAGQREPQQKAGMGARVTLKDVTSGRKMVYTLVDVREADAASGRISTVSPVGQALLDRKVGDEVIIQVPRGTLRYLIEDIGG